MAAAKDKKKDRFDEFIEKYFAPGPNTDFMDPFSLIGLLIYGSLKLVSKTRQKYRGWKEKSKLNKSIYKKLEKIRLARNRNAEKATSLDQLSPDIQAKARQMAKNMIKGNSPVAKGRNEDSLTFDIAKDLQTREEKNLEQNPWVSVWKKDVEKELRDEIFDGKKISSNKQFTQEYIDRVNSPDWLTDQTNIRANQYVNQLVREDPSLKGKEAELFERVQDGAYEQAMVDRQVYNDFFSWQKETKERLLNEAMKSNDPEAKNENKPEQQLQKDENRPEENQRNINGNKPEQPRNNGREGEAVAPKAPEAARQKAPEKMPRWMSGEDLDHYLSTDLKPAKDQQESKEFADFRKSMEELAKATKDEGKDKDLLSSEYVDVYDKSKAYLEKLKKEPGNNEPEGRKQVAQNIVDNFDKDNLIDKYRLLKNKDLSKIENLDQKIAELNNPLAKKPEQVKRELEGRRTVKERDKEKEKDKELEKDGRRRSHSMGPRQHKLEQEGMAIGF